MDLRTRRAFAAGHLPGTLNFELSTNFVTYLGWLYDWGAPLTLIGATEADVADARRELVRIGVDRLAGAATVPADGAWPGELGSYPVRDFAALAAALRDGGAVVLDTRRDDERAAGGVRGSLHVPIHELAAPPRRDPRRRGVGVLRLRLPGLRRRVDAGPHGPPSRAGGRRVRRRGHRLPRARPARRTALTSRTAAGIAVRNGTGTIG